MHAFDKQASARLGAGFAASTAILSVLLSAPAAAQSGPAPGIPTAEEQVDIPPPVPDEPLAPVDPEFFEPEPAPATDPDEPTGEASRAIDFEADALEYDQSSDTITASGNVILRSEDQSLRADSVRWNRQTGDIVADGNVRLVDELGNQLYSDSLLLDDEFEAGAMDNLLLALAQGGRLAAAEGRRGEDGAIILERAAYSACAVIDAEGCEKSPSWRITAERVVYDTVNDTVKFRGAYLELFGARVLPLPGLAIRTDGEAASGFLAPNLRVSQVNGLEVNGSYYWRLADNRDLTLGAYAFTEAPPMVSGQWRHLLDKGAYQITGYLTSSRRIGGINGFNQEPTSERDIRGYIFANGQYQFSPEWSLSASIRRASDRTFLRRYDITREDRLRSTFELARVDDTSYFALTGWETQTLRLNAPQGEVPVALPIIDYRKRLADPIAGGTVQLQANTLAISREVGQDTQRAFAKAQWDRRSITAGGQVLTLSVLGRADVYHTDDVSLTETVQFRGNEGWEARAFGLGAVDLEWPLVGRAFGGTQVLTPRVQVVASTPIRNLAFPNEDARAFDLEDSNLFALNRFPGYDRIEESIRVTYGLDWELRRPGWEILATIGQSIRADEEPGFLVDGTGIYDRVSDIVGRTRVRYRDFLSFTHRYRIDKDDFALRRNEIDATIGSRRTYAEVGYLRLDRDIDVTVEDLDDREELRFAGRVAFADYWSVFAAGIVNLTDAEEDPTLTSDGFDPIRTRLGIAYEDDCLEIGLTWRRDFITAGDAVSGNTFQLNFSLKNLGFR
ncbi:LPS assembly protein LptD [Altererythrobacter aurantiacus]|uniref:LPS-assembly protein LptD n=1 Tax=Parapontixanthobacter aurantiacus TaxID=1463599 RepID=A0A844ZFL3_9SPHN|nr:LPS assembly protein LptD [Parapontixanthobacter aurantiacus]MXO85750.1 LPS assembly protein LptD [Parapontixanthobacter aurantiacus]